MPRTQNILPTSIGSDHCAALKMNNSHQDSSSSIAWSRNGSCRNEGIFFAHLTHIKSSLAAVSNTFSLLPVMKELSVGRMVWGNFGNCWWTGWYGVCMLLGENVSIFGVSFGDSSGLEVLGLVEDVTFGLSVWSDDGEPSNRKIECFEKFAFISKGKFNLMVYTHLLLK